MKQIPDKELLLRLKAGDQEAFKFLYGSYFPYVTFFVLKNKGSQHDAEDVFQETMLVLLKKVDDPEFALHASLKTYLYAIAKNIWLKKIRDNRFVPLGNLELLQTDAPAADGEREDRIQGLGRWVTAITRHCQLVIKAFFFYKMPMDAVMSRMGWKNRHTAANQQYKCLQQIRRERQREELLKRKA